MIFDPTPCRIPLMFEPLQVGWPATGTLAEQGQSPVPVTPGRGFVVLPGRLAHEVLAEQVSVERLKVSALVVDGVIAVAAVDEVGAAVSRVVNSVVATAGPDVVRTVARRQLVGATVAAKGVSGTRAEQVVGVVPAA